MNLIKKVSIILLCIMFFSFFNPLEVFAAKDVEIGGKLLGPIVDFTVTVGDSFVAILHKALFGEWVSLLKIDTSLTAWNVLGITAGAILSIAGIVAICAVPGVRTAVLAKVTSGAIAAALASGAAAAATVAVGTLAVGGGVYTVWNSFPDNIVVLPLYSVSPEEIFSNELALFDVDFFNPKGYKDADGNWIQDYVTDAGTTVKVSATAAQLQSIVATWYNILRDIAIVASLSILVYIGIKILLSSTSNDKAKYKQMIMDWVVALCLLFMMQYIMSFSNIIVKKVTDLVKVTVPNSTQYFCTMEYDDKILDALDEKFGAGVWTEEKLLVQPVGTKEQFTWPTNIMGNMRIGAAQEIGETADSVGHAICFLALVFYTIFFAFTYLKRVVYMAFLTMVAPLVALTYPIDKINDGKAQAFDMWLKEYIFNLLIQPLHLLLYTILIVSAIQLSGTNILYSIVAIGFMIPSEKLMRKFFGFEKAQTPGLLAGPAGAAMVMSGMNKLLNKGGHKGGSSGSGKGGKSDSDRDDTKINMSDKFDAGNIFSSGFDKQQQGSAFFNNGSTNNGNLNNGSINNGNLNNGSINNGNLNNGSINNGNKNKTPQQRMYDADNEKYDSLNAGWDERQEMNNNYNDAYGFMPDSMYNSDEERIESLRNAGFSDEEINDIMGIKDNQAGAGTVGQRMYDADNENYDSLGADWDERQEMENNFNDAYGLMPDVMYNSDQEVMESLRNAGLSEEEINDVMGIENNNPDKTIEQKMYDADNESYDSLNADWDERQEMDKNYNDAYGLTPDEMYNSDRERLDSLKNAGLFDDEYDDNGENNEEMNRRQAIEAERRSVEDMGDTKTDYQRYAFNPYYLNNNMNPMYGTVNNNQPQHKRSLSRALKRTAGHYTEGMKKKIANKIENAQPEKKIVRALGGAAVGLTTGIIAGGASLTTGDPSKVAQYTAAATYGGYRFGASKAESARQALSVEEETGRKFAEEYYGKDEMKRRESLRRVKQVQSNKQLRWDLEDKIGKTQADYFMKNSIPYYDSMKIDISNTDDLITMAQMENDGIDRDKVIATKLYKDTLIGDKDSKYLSAKAEKENNETIRRDAARRGLSPDDQERYQEDINDHIRVFDDYKYGRENDVNQDYGKMNSHMVIRDVQKDQKLREDLKLKIGEQDTDKFMKEAVRQYEGSGIDITKKEDLMAMARMEKSGISRDKVIETRQIKDRIIGDRDSKRLVAPERKAKDDMLKQEAQRRGISSAADQQKYQDELNKHIKMFDDFKYGRR